MMWNLEFYCQFLLIDFFVKMQTFQTITLLYLTLLVYPQLWFWIEFPKPKKEKTGFFSKLERQKLQSLYTQSGAAFGHVRNVVKTSNLPVSKVRQFSESKHSYTEITLVTCKLKERRHLPDSKVNFGVWT